MRLTNHPRELGSRFQKSSVPIDLLGVLERAQRNGTICWDSTFACVFFLFGISSEASRLALKRQKENTPGSSGFSEFSCFLQ